MGDKIKPSYKSDFDLFPEGIFYFITDKVDVRSGDDAKDSVKFFKVESLAQGGDEDGMRVFDNFPLVSKKNFGLARLSGFLIKIGLFKPKDEYDSDMFGTQKFEDGFKVGVPGKGFYGRVKHNKSKQGTEMANIVEYYTIEEGKVAKAELEKSGKKGAAKGKEAPAAEEPLDFEA